MVLRTRHTAANAELFLSGYRYLESNDADLRELEAVATIAHLQRPEFRHQMKVCMLAICQVADDLGGTYHAWGVESPDDFPYASRASHASGFGRELRSRITGWYSSKARKLDRPFLEEFVTTIKDSHDLRDLMLAPLRGFLLDCHARGLVSLRGVDQRRNWNG